MSNYILFRLLSTLYVYMRLVNFEVRILKEKLIPDEKLAQIRQYFEADWQKCRAYAESNS